ncbi:MAG TPA: DUF4276 family protein [Thermoflexia bacterium]|nr:DUF4276 family protein [Thermoflexia bacterium]
MVRQLRAALNRGENYDLILVMDDLDCHVAEEREKLFRDTINAVLGEFPDMQSDRMVIGFAAPEIEAWLIADWSNTFAKDLDFRAHHGAMRHCLASQHNVSFAEPENFSTLDEKKDACEEKLSALIMEAALDEANVHYSKAVHTPRLLQEMLVPVVIGKCPLFRQWYRELEKFIPQEQ